MSKSMRGLFDDMDDCATVRSLDLLGRLHRWGVDDQYHSGAFERPSNLSLKELCRRHATRIKLLWLNTYLMPQIDLDVPFATKSVHDAAPARMQRALEIGQMIRSEGFDVAALCEVWTDDSRTTILNNWNPWPTWSKGPEKSYLTLKVEVPGVSDILGLFGVDASIKVITIELLSSGLFTLLPGPFGLVAWRSVRFSDEGVTLRDADAWSNKGILQVVIPSGHGGNIEFYTTHLISGNDLKSESGDTETVVADVARSQIGDLVSFIQATHDPANFIVVAGDFNISDSGACAGYLSQRMEDELGLEDVWTRYAQPKYQAQLGGTQSYDGFPRDPLNPNYIGDCTKSSGGCPDDVLKSDSRRIDHVFVQKASSKTAVHVEVSRPRRRHFQREPSAPEYDACATLSDHVGIELRLFTTDVHVFAQPSAG